MIDHLLASMPLSFSFYHLGEVELQPAEPLQISDDQIAILFHLYGDVNAALILVLSQALDLSTYSEMGNIIASKMASHLSNEEGLGVSISPPKVLNHRQFDPKMAEKSGIVRTYLHKPAGDSLPIHLHALLIPTEGSVGHA